MTDSKAPELKPCPFCGGEAEIIRNDIGVFIGCFNVDCLIGPATSTYVDGYATEADAIAAWNSRAELGSENCARCAEDMGRYADSLCDPLKEHIAELLRCLENDWNLSASWDGLRKFWHIGLTEEGVRLRDAEQAIAAMLGNDRVTENSIDKWLRKFQREHGEFAHIGPGELKDLAFALHDDIPLGYEASMRLGQWLLHATLGSGTCDWVPLCSWLWECSNCGETHHRDDAREYRYCPFCGAKCSGNVQKTADEW